MHSPKLQLTNSNIYRKRSTRTSCFTNLERTLTHDARRHRMLCSDATAISRTKCGDKGSCRRSFHTQRPLNTSANFGCFFTAPDAAAQMSPMYSTCGEPLTAGSMV